jgi:hypothetical protein
MSEPQLWLLLLGLAIVVDGLLAGASLDQSIKQLPARHRIGMRAFSTYRRASDLASGVFWYACLGIAGAVLTLASAAWGLALELSPDQRLPLLLAAALAIAHSLRTARAGPDAPCGVIRAQAFGASRAVEAPQRCQLGGLGRGGERPFPIPPPPAPAASQEALQTGALSLQRVDREGEQALQASR